MSTIQVKVWVVATGHYEDSSNEAGVMVLGSKDKILPALIDFYGLGEESDSKAPTTLEECIDAIMPYAWVWWDEREVWVTQ